MKNNLKWTIAGVLQVGAAFCVGISLDVQYMHDYIRLDRSTLYGALMGGLFAKIPLVKPKPKSEELNSLHPDETKLNSEKEKLIE
ncbi:MAG: hypothetical protein IPG90_21140 [Bacteroidetes bacterium]|nr:hypothetical protein [Bacteroidota bacterium]